jgi:hypothetical protein
MQAAHRHRETAFGKFAEDRKVSGQNALFADDRFPHLHGSSGLAVSLQAVPPRRADRLLRGRACRRARIHATCWLLAITARHSFALSPRIARESCMYSSPLKGEGVGNAGRQAHPQPRVRKVLVKCTRVFTARSPKSPGIPTQWFTAYTALSSEIGLCCLRRPWSNLHELDAGVEASGPHDFAVRFSALVRSTSTSTASRPASVTIASRPSDGTRRRGIRR